ncbi:hypothetical protein HGA06_09265 [Streptomyces somaliensis DSM 40738]|uniref:Secreted protein n=1 Tax=Streptomyces somaliensis (strain ATCC 33201 / DSM 40738 / JCM 12659 / KCTC 9044 / NCTC 11332 / NRRL B-12077 / IP 733) TaxID=1134445 RepID=A0AA44DCY3_STRE0|nr:hypothetical protein [Streptomyces somaliensis DSM 40738]
MRHRRTAAPTAVVLAALLAGSAAPVGPAAADDHGERTGASCRTEVDGSRVTAYCHNPYPHTDRVRLHVECARWWDVDADSAPVEVPATAYVELTERCWKEVGAAWISHDPLPGPGS